MMLGSFFTAVPLSIVTRHFSASYAVISKRQEDQSKAMLKFTTARDGDGEAKRGGGGGGGGVGGAPGGGSRGLRGLRRLSSAIVGISNKKLGVGVGVGLGGLGEVAVVPVTAAQAQTEQQEKQQGQGQGRGYSLLPAGRFSMSFFSSSSSSSSTSSSTTTSAAAAGVALQSLGGSDIADLDKKSVCVPGGPLPLSLPLSLPLPSSNHNMRKDSTVTRMDDLLAEFRSESDSVAKAAKKRSMGVMDVTKDYKSSVRQIAAIVKQVSYFDSTYLPT